MPRGPAVRISRSTVHRATPWPCRRSSAWTFRAPQTPLAACTFSITAVVTASMIDRAEGGRVRYA
jgi:hypothetical protein